MNHFHDVVCTFTATHILQNKMAMHQMRQLFKRGKTRFPCKWQVLWVVPPRRKPHNLFLKKPSISFSDTRETTDAAIMWLDKKRNSNVQHANTSAIEQLVLENQKNKINKSINTYIYVFNVWRYLCNAMVVISVTFTDCASQLSELGGFRTWLSN